VLIVGAGPTGLVLALWLTKFGIPVRIIDKLGRSGTTSRALAVQARTLEYYQQIGLADPVVERGHKVAGLNLWVRSRQAARVPLSNLGQGLTPFPFPIIFPQDEHETLLIERLRELGVEVERLTELSGFEERGEEIVATLQRTGVREERVLNEGVREEWVREEGMRKEGARGQGVPETASFAYIAGCDGARSRVREVLATGFPGGTYDHLFYVADVEASGPPVDGELHVDLDDADFLAVFPMSGSGRARLVGSVRDDAAKDHEHLQLGDVQGRAMHNLKIEITRVNWFSTYRVHHRVAQQFRRGRAFLLGDAAHIHSPVGGQGMNTGIGDAVNLAWKLAAAIREPASAALLDSYEPERIAFARRLVATTDRAFTAVISTSEFARIVRTRILPLVAPTLFRIPAMRRFAFRTVSQIEVNYRQSPLSAGRAGRLCGGDRLPWVQVDAGGGEFNFRALTSLAWQVHVYGEASRDLSKACEDRRVHLQIFEWRAPMGRAGLKRNAAYLIRPDGYIALAVEDGKPTTIDKYLHDKSIRTTR
jgi:2-polyprenyl-6-methoxyphenol hydroxylase-like FAD-dependent oxidoreductase